MAQRAEDLTLVATVQAEATDLASVATAVVEQKIAAASDACRRYVGRYLHRATVTETHEARGGVKLFLERTPIVSVTSVSYDGTAYATGGTDYETHDAEMGVLYRLQGWPWYGRALPGLLQDDRLARTERKLLSVVYVAGWITPYQATAGGGSVGTRDLPYDIEQACVDTAVALLRARGRDSSISAESIGVASVSYRNPNAVTGLGAAGWIPDSAAAILKQYRTLR